MSRIGKAPIPIPQGVEAKIEGAFVTVKGPKGSLTRRINQRIAVSIEDGNIIVSRPDEARQHVLGLIAKAAPELAGAAPAGLTVAGRGLP